MNPNWSGNSTKFWSKWIYRQNQRKSSRIIRWRRSGAWSVINKTFNRGKERLPEIRVFLNQDRAASTGTSGLRSVHKNCPISRFSGTLHPRIWRNFEPIWIQMINPPVEADPRRNPWIRWAPPTQRKFWRNSKFRWGMHDMIDFIKCISKEKPFSIEFYGESL